MYRYTGEINSRLERHGKGCYLFDSPSAVYEGHYVNGVRKGLGKLTFGGTEIKGEFDDDGEISGLFVKSWPNGTTYTGLLHRGEMCGFGELRKPSGEVYEGEWRDNKRHGVGKLVCAQDGSSYQGGWEYHRYHGKGTLQASGYKFQGTFHRGKEEGFGEATWPDGSWYKGMFRDGLRSDSSGEAVFQCANTGIHHTGSWFDGVPDAAVMVEVTALAQTKQLQASGEGKAAAKGSKRKSTKAPADPSRVDLLLQEGGVVQSFMAQCCYDPGPEQDEGEEEKQGKPPVVAVGESGRKLECTLHRRVQSEEGAAELSDAMPFFVDPPDAEDAALSVCRIKPALEFLPQGQALLVAVDGAEKGIEVVLGEVMSNPCVVLNGSTGNVRTPLVWFKGPEQKEEEGHDEQGKQEEGAGCSSRMDLIHGVTFMLDWCLELPTDVAPITMEKSGQDECSYDMPLLQLGDWLIIRAAVSSSEEALPLPDKSEQTTHDEVEEEKEDANEEGTTRSVLRCTGISVALGPDARGVMNCPHHSSQECSCFASNGAWHSLALTLKEVDSQVTAVLRADGSDLGLELTADAAGMPCGALPFNLGGQWEGDGRLGLRRLGVYDDCLAPPEIITSTSVYKQAARDALEERRVEGVDVEATKEQAEPAAQESVLRDVRACVRGQARFSKLRMTQEVLEEGGELVMRVRDAQPLSGEAERASIFPALREKLLHLTL
ncbi:unnamed protein product [Chrysoparadoxa australica]